MKSSTANEVLAIITAGHAGKLECGRRALLLAHLVEPALVGGTQTALAARLGITRAAVSKEVAKIRRGLGSKYGTSTNRG